MTREQLIRENGELFRAILSLESAEECAAFFEDLLTPNELEQMSLRLKAAELLLADKTYEQIIEATNISSATLSRVSRCVRFGDGYKAVLKKMGRSS